MSTRFRHLAAALAAAALLAGCGANDAIDNVQNDVDRAQESVDRAQEVINDPIDAARDEADRRLEDAVSPEDQP